jgi:hypothetical protein
LINSYRDVKFVTNLMPRGVYMAKHRDIRSEVFTAVTMKNAAFGEVTLCGSCKDRSLGGMYRVHHPGDKNRRARNNISSN